jgi:radical SAM superfamily enzyme YgiQ (UPF0313 family)
MRVGVLDLLTTPSLAWSETVYNLVMSKQYASITPQAIAVWCRQAGHQTFYATYYGIGDPRARLPDDLDVVFIATYSQASAFAYALAKLYRRDGTLTVVGGPHAKAFPLDCARFFDVVVLECDRALVADVVAGRIGPGAIVSSARPYTDVPSVEERLPEIRRAAFARGRRPFFATTVPLLASTGCPYACDFCIDGRTPYRQLDLAGLARDLDWVAAELPDTMVGFHDPNFAVRFDEVLDLMERRPPSARNPYIMETSLAVLRPDRVARLGATRCAAVAPGIESWGEYSGKAGLGRPTGAAKVARLAEHFDILHQHVPYLQANFMFGLDGDRGDEPIALTKEFMTRTPFVWPVVNIPHPFGGTPLQERYLREGRVLRMMPFSFYYSPWVVTTFRHYDPVEYYDRLIDVFAHFTSSDMLLRRLRATTSAFVRTAHVVRTRVKRRRLRAFRRLRDLLRTDRELRRFHEGRSTTLPELYHREYERMLGPYASLMSRADRTPELAGLPRGSAGGRHGGRVPADAGVELLGVPV